MGHGRAAGAAARLGDLALYGIAVAAHLQGAAGQGDALHGHFILGDGARLIRADHAGTAQRLHGVQFADDGAAAQDAPHAEGQGDGDDGGQALGDGGHGQADAREQHGKEIVALQEAQKAHGQTDDHAGDGHEAAQLLQLDLQRRGLFLRLVHQAGDLAHLGGHAGGRHHALAPAGRQVAAHVQAVTGLFLHGQALAGQHGLVAGHARPFAQAAVRRHLVPGLEQQHVAGHHAPGADLHLAAGAAHAGGGGAQFLQRLQRFFRAVFLQKAHDGVQQHDQDDGDGLGPLPHQDADERGRGQDEDHHILELREEHGGNAVLPFARQAVLPHLRQARGRLCLAEASAVLFHAPIPPLFAIASRPVSVYNDIDPAVL